MLQTKITLPSTPQTEITLNIIKSKRKSMSLTVNSNAELVARVPLRCDLNNLYDFIRSKSNWVLKQINSAKSNPYKGFVVENGAELTIIDEVYQIIITDTKRAKLQNGVIILPNVNTKAWLITILKKYAKRYLENKVNELSTQFGFSFSKISVGSAKTMWGSCNSKNKLTFTYALILTPQFVVDYIIVHELCHTKVKNHSKTFYNEVQKCMPNYKLAERWLKENKGIINLLRFSL